MQQGKLLRCLVLCSLTSSLSLFTRVDAIEQNAISKPSKKIVGSVTKIQKTVSDSDKLKKDTKIAMHLYEQGKYKLAEAKLKACIDTVSHAGFCDDERATAYNNMGVVQLELRDFVTAKKCFDTALKLNATSHVVSNADTAKFKNGLATLYRRIGHLETAKGLFFEALEINRKTLGSDIEAALYMNNLASLYKAQGSLSDAEIWFSEALRIRKSSLNSNDLRIAKSLNNLGSLLALEKRFSEAESLYNKALVIARSNGGCGENIRAAILNNLGETMEELGRERESELLYRNSIKIADRLFGKHNWESAPAENNLALVLEKKGKYDDAEKLYRATTQKDTSDSIEAAVTNRNLARLYLIQQRYELAEPLLLEALRTTAQALGPDSESSKEIKRSMTDLYKNLIPDRDTRIALQKLRASALVSTSAIK